MFIVQDRKWNRLIEFTLNDGNHRYKALIRNGYTEHYVIIWTTSKSDYEDFINRGFYNDNSKNRL